MRSKYSNPTQHNTSPCATCEADSVVLDSSVGRRYLKRGNVQKSDGDGDVEMANGSGSGGGGGNSVSSTVLGDHEIEWSPVGAPLRWTSRRRQRRSVPTGLEYPRSDSDDEGNSNVMPYSALQLLLQQVCLVRPFLLHRGNEFFDDYYQRNFPRYKK